MANSLLLKMASYHEFSHQKMIFHSRVKSPEGIERLKIKKLATELFQILGFQVA